MADITRNHDKQILAKKLFINQNRTAKETAFIVGVTEKTMGRWVKRFNWRETQQKQSENRLANDGLLSADTLTAIKDVKKFLMANHPLLNKQIESAITYYLSIKP